MSHCLFFYGVRQLEMLIFFSSLELFVYLILQIFEPGARNVIDIWVNVHQSNDKICQDLTYS